jgi:hypothetical protein
LILTIIFLVVESLLNQHHVDCVLVAYLSRSYWSEIIGDRNGFFLFKRLIFFLNVEFVCLDFLTYRMLEFTPIDILDE